MRTQSFFFFNFPIYFPSVTSRVTIGKCFDAEECLEEKLSNDSECFLKRNKIFPEKVPQISTAELCVTYKFIFLSYINFCIVMLLSVIPLLCSFQGSKNL
jgi:hypothetical protein